MAGWGSQQPLELFLAERPQRSTGSVVVSSLGERDRFLWNFRRWYRNHYPMPKRMANGWNRIGLSLLLAVMEKRLGMHLGTGCVRECGRRNPISMSRPSTWVLWAAVTSSLRESRLISRLWSWAKSVLGGEVRAISQAEMRIREAAKMGFKRCLLPERNVAKLDPVDGIELVGIREVGDALDAVLA